jgi:putative transposase
MNSNQGRVHEIIRQKRRWHTPPDPEAAKLGFRSWHSRGYLPHFDTPGAVQMVSYRLHDAMPATKRHEWAALISIEDPLQRHFEIEDYLDSGRGGCVLQIPTAARIVEDNWLHFDGERYRVLAWVVMPNHVHVLVEIWETPLSELMKRWKGYTARQINDLLGREGKVWQEDYWDRFIRDEAHFRKVVHYIEANPVKVGLVRSAAEWQFSSTRHRDECGRLKT